MSTGRHKARSFLERKLNQIKSNQIEVNESHGYDVAITAYALALAQSQDADLAYGKLLAIKREEDGMVYWGKSKITTNRF